MKSTRTTTAELEREIKRITYYLGFTKDSNLYNELKGMGLWLLRQERTKSEQTVSAASIFGNSCPQKR